MSALIAQAVELHRNHSYMPFWQCVELARHLQSQSAHARKRCERRHEAGEREAGERSRVRDHTFPRLTRASSRRGRCAAHPAG
jgi:hypothetical protein